MALTVSFAVSCGVLSCENPVAINTQIKGKHVLGWNDKRPHYKQVALELCHLFVFCVTALMAFIVWTKCH